ncbi:DUF3307 domain-containing protein [Candidatus Sumerlaeota bacterium]|nr:DUF3307 domain-containing protein [Candidatus Sumerlaeota bacterium]
MERLLLMLAAHAVADYPLQGDFLAKAKNRSAPLPGVPWWQALGAHAVIHGAAVGIITRSPALGVAETIVHAITDDLKCNGRLSYNQDQAIHAGCKLVWALAASAIEARRAETAQHGSVADESAVPQGDAHD